MRLLCIRVYVYVSSVRPSLRCRGVCALRRRRELVAPALSLGRRVFKFTRTARKRSAPRTRQPTTRAGVSHVVPTRFRRVFVFLVVVVVVVETPPRGAAVRTRKHRVLIFPPPNTVGPFDPSALLSVPSTPLRPPRDLPSPCVIHRRPPPPLTPLLDQFSFASFRIVRGAPDARRQHIALHTAYHYYYYCCGCMRFTAHGRCPRRPDLSPKRNDHVAADPFFRYYTRPKSVARVYLYAFFRPKNVSNAAFL